MSLCEGDQPRMDLTIWRAVDLLLVPELPLKRHFIRADLVADLPDTVARKLFEPFRFPTSHGGSRVLFIGELFSELGGQSSIGCKQREKRKV